MRSNEALVVFLVFNFFHGTLCKLEDKAIQGTREAQHEVCF
jgi:hypothetical protein